MAEFSIAGDNEIWDEIAIRWQSGQIEELNRVLKSHGIEDPAIRRKVLEEFFFSMATMLDGSSSGIEYEEKEYRPRLAFEDRESEGAIMVSDKYDLHSNTLWDIDAIFEEEAKG